MRGGSSVTETDVRIDLAAYAWELIPGDLVVDTWEGTSFEVERIDVQDRQVVVHYTDGSTFTATRRPGQEPILTVQRRVEDGPEPVIVSTVEQDDAEGPTADV